MSGKIIVDSERSNFVFSSYAEGTRGSEMAVLVQREANKRGATFLISYDNEKTPIMCVEGPATMVRAMITTMEEMEVGFGIDVSASDEPNIVRR